MISFKGLILYVMLVFPVQLGVSSYLVSKGIKEKSLMWWIGIIGIGACFLFSLEMFIKNSS